MAESEKDQIIRKLKAENKGFRNRLPILGENYLIINPKY